MKKRNCIRKYIICELNFPSFHKGHAIVRDKPALCVPRVFHDNFIIARPRSRIGRSLATSSELDLLRRARTNKSKIRSGRVTRRSVVSRLSIWEQIKVGRSVIADSTPATTRDKFIEERGERDSFFAVKFTRK